MNAPHMDSPGDVTTALYEATEVRLKEWGAACGHVAEHHELPRSMGLRKIIEHVQRHEQTRKAHYQTKRAPKPESEVKRRECLDCRHVGRKWGAVVDGKWQPHACPNCHSLMTKEREPTALGKETESPPALGIQSLSYAVMQIDAIVATLPGWMQQPLRRRYCFNPPDGQPDRVAADELKIDKARYQARLKAGVMRVAEILGRAK